MIENTEFYKIKAVDVDYGINSKIDYSILSTTFPDGTFKLEEDADSFVKVVNTKVIDLEELAEYVYNITIEAKEIEGCEATECLSASTTCTLQIEDINDNKPGFASQSYVAYVKENVAVADIFLFNETSSGDELNGTIEVFDKDKTPNFNQINIGFEQDSFYDSFTINPTLVLSSGFITIMSRVPGLDNPLLDYEQSEDKTIEIILQATDKNDETLVATTQLLLQIVDINDNAPKFTEKNYQVTVAEDLSDIGDSNILISVEATDEDISENYGKLSLRYSLKTQLSGVSIDDVTGDIIIDSANNPFDAEESTEVVLEVEARDCGNTELECDPFALTDSAMVTITVTNVNDNQPESVTECEKTFENTMTYENDIVMTLEAQDADGDTVTFSLIEEGLPENFPFAIDKTTGSISMNKALLKEVEKEFLFEIQLEDDGLPDLQTSRTQCSFNVIDVNDKVPQFIFPVAEEKYWIDVHSAIGSPLTLYDGSPLRVHAEDEDANQCYSSLGYTFQSNVNAEYTEFFSLNDIKGDIVLNKNLSSLQLEEDTNGIKNLVTLPIKVSDGYNGCSADHNSNNTNLLLKVFTDFEPKFTVNSDIVDFNETSSDAVMAVIPQAQLRLAIDDNNVDNPEGDSFNQKIFYYMVNSSEAAMKHFYVDKEDNILGIKSSLDVDGCTGPDCDSFSINIVATNDATKPPTMFDPSSILNVRVTVNDLNDNIPEFQNVRSYYVYSTLEGECKDCSIQASDKDNAIDTELSFQIINQTSSDPNVMNTTQQPFFIELGADNKSVTILKSPDFNPDPDAQLYFDLDIKVTDKADHSSTAPVKIVIMTGINNVTFGFVNSREHVENNMAEVQEIFQEVFEWTFSPKGIKESSRNYRSSDITTLEGYFVDPQNNFKPKSQPEIATRYDERFDDLYLALVTRLNISLDTSQGFRGATTDDWSNPDTRAAIIVGSITAGLLFVTGVFLLTAYCLRTRALERRVKAMDTQAVDTKAANVNGQDNHLAVPGMVDIPGSNEFAGSGANPIWQAAMENEEYTEDDLHFLEEMSEYSGDSILIGVEDQTEFQDYKERVDQAEEDMELYNKMWGKYKTMDQYQAQDKDDGMIPVQHHSNEVDTYF